MSKNPFESPQADGLSANAEASGLVSGPAISLIVLGIINVLMALYALVNGVVALIMGDQLIQNNPGFQELQQQPDAPPIDMNQMNQFVAIGGAVYLVMGIVGLVFAAVIVLGALKMKSLKSFGLAMTSAIFAMIPVCSCCCPVGLPIGIWALIVLMKPEVKSAFG